MENSAIEWTTHTGNLWWGCTEVHAGCDNCYARTFSNRFDKQLWGNDQPRQAVKSVWGNLAKWQAEAAGKDETTRVFVGSMMDIFEKPQPIVDHNGEPLEGSTADLRNRFFNTFVPACPDLLFLLLTKRPSNVLKMVPPSWLHNPPANVMVGASVVDALTAFQVCKQLGKVKEVGFKTFWSVEPLLAPLHTLTLETIYRDKLPDWIIVGGESGPNRRRFNPNWARDVKRLCRRNGIAFFGKQWDKVQPLPADLLIREFPTY